MRTHGPSFSSRRAPLRRPLSSLEGELVPPSRRRRPAAALLASGQEKGRDFAHWTVGSCSHARCARKCRELFSLLFIIPHIGSRRIIAIQFWVLFERRIELCGRDLRGNGTGWTILVTPSYNLIFPFTTLVGSRLFQPTDLRRIMLARPRSKVSRWGMFAETHL